MTLEPIGTFFADSKYPYEARRQASADNSLGEIRLNPGFEQALEDLEGFERLWIIFQFHHNSDWKPKVMPPRGPRIKRGVFATRAPYRPNALGLSCVRLIKVEGLRVIVEGHDLLDGTPILDIKPYLPYADAFPEAKVGWLEDIESEKWQVNFSPQAEQQIKWLERQGLTQLKSFIQAQLEFDPLDNKRKRVEKYKENFRLSYRTWRAEFTADEGTRSIHIESIHSGYSEADLSKLEDPYEDKNLHREFLNHDQYTNKN
jgi:tRNA-Thr(GGU) m(6)t(6)A37 methyltransferase TsaA